MITKAELKQMNLAEEVRSYKLPYHINVEWVSYLAFLITIGPIIFLGAVAFLFNASAWPIPIIGAVLLGSILLAIGASQISLLEDEIVLRTLFSKKAASYPEISRIFVGYVNSGKSPYPRLLIFIVGADKPISIPIKPFSSRNLLIMVFILSIKAPQAEIEDWIHVFEPR